MDSGEKTTCPYCLTDSVGDVCPVCHPDHIADATKKVQPARCPHCGYTPDAVQSDFAAYAQADCEHRESHAKPAPAELEGEATSEGCGQPAPAPRTQECGNANGSDGVSGGNPRTPAPLPMPEGIQQARDSMRQYFDDTVHPNDSYSVYCQLVDDLDTMEDHISDLTRRLAEAEEQLSGVGVRQYREAVERLHKAEAFKSRVMEWARGRCKCCGHYTNVCEYQLECCHGESWTPPQAWEVGE